MFLPKCKFSESTWFPYKCVLFLLIFQVGVSELVVVLGLSAVLQRLFYGLVKENNKLSVCQAVLEVWRCRRAVQHIPKDIGGGKKTNPKLQSFENFIC